MTISKFFDLAGRNALVTGSSRGIGRAIALALAECGATVAVHGTRSTPALEETCADVRRFSPGSVAVTGDLSLPDVPAQIVADAATGLGGLHIVVANASIQIRKPWADVTQAEAEEQMQVNFHATLRLIQAALPTLRAQHWGRIVTVGSIQQQRPHPDMIVYAASKAAQENLVRNLAKQLGPEGITVNNLAPGVILTDRNTDALANQVYAERVRGMIPLRFFGESSDCVGAALLLCSDAGRYITGVDLLVDGGMHL
jgi:NAD(P)-dependent dehydrogenase (short-subunit alcohol dehydrogenase family)